MTENLSVFTLVTLALKLSMMKAKYSLVVATMVPFRPADAKLAVIVKEQELIKKFFRETNVHSTNCAQSIMKRCYDGQGGSCTIPKTQKRPYKTRP